ncbi:unnamed protein product [Adineta ricciae]|uniref:Uncharacterized protein n=1 Tax=Adineta ricciae TaxID=249248 RepID=A0A813M630_ADIRI|nr:unnamed protein product [Adineta ricciae]CAF0908443.1 unnamed protein product [Adineta ricciae]
MTYRNTLTYLFFIYCFAILPRFIDASDCYFCPNCLNSQRGVRLPARADDWCYKIVWRSGPGNHQMVSRGASADCRQDAYNDQSMTMPSIFSGTARYCCRGHLCNSVPKRMGYSRILLLFLVFVQLGKNTLGSYSYLLW